MLQLIQKKNKTQTIMLLILSITFLCMANYTFDRKVAVSGDNANYYILGKSIAQGKGITNIHYTDETPASRFTPGYPVIIGGAMQIFGAEITGIKLLNYLFLLGAVILLFFIIKQITGSENLAFVTALLCVMNVHLLSYATIIMSEIPFLFFSLLTFFFLLRSKQNFEWKDYYFWLFLLALVGSYYVRTIGVALLVASCGYFVFSKRWKQLGVTVIGFVIVALPWYLRTKSSGGNNYANQLSLINPLRPEMGHMKPGDWMDRIIRNLDRYFTKEIPTTIFPKDIDYSLPPTVADLLFGIFIVAAIIYGIFRLKQARILIGAYCAATFAIVLLWPEVWFGPRFIVPLIPLFMLGVANTIIIGVTWLSRWLKLKTTPAIQSTIVYVPLLLILFSFGEMGALHQRGKEAHPGPYHRYVQLAQWTEKNIDKNAVIACRKDALFYLFSERKVTLYKFTDNPEEFLDDLKAKGVTHVVFDELGYSSYGKYLLPAAQHYSGKFVRVFGFDDLPTQLCELRTDLGYFGDRKNGLRHGQGRFIWFDGKVYDGQWENNQKNGRGVIYDAAGQVIEKGIWKDNVLIQKE
jgi:4-amino-4-deoxy-L-arabinose transferase-like glycosyltransferase